MKDKAQTEENKLTAVEKQRWVLLITCWLATTILISSLSYSRGYTIGYLTGRYDGMMNIAAGLVKGWGRTEKEIKEKDPDFWKELKPYYFNEENQ